MTGEGVAAIIGASFSGVISLVTVLLQYRQSKVSAANTLKLDAQGVQIQAVHEATTAIQSATGTFKALSPPP